MAPFSNSTMPNHPKAKPSHDDPAQSKRFLELARELDADVDDNALEASVKRLGKHGPEPRRKIGKKAKAKRKSA